MNNKIILKNKKAYYDYEIIKEYEAGLVLKGYEIKSIRNKKLSIKEAFCKIIKNEIFIFNMNISKYENANSFYEIDEKRVRKLLLHKKEIKFLEENTNLNGYTIIPLYIYFNEKNKCKLKIALVKGKKNHDKRNSIKERENKINLARYYRN